jgi:hypothetical protein
VCAVRAARDMCVSRRRNQLQNGADELICTEALWHPDRLMLRAPLALSLVLIASACGSTRDHGVLGTVDLGDNFVAPDLALDEDFFYCRIQPEVLQRHGCANGEAGERGSCHTSRSALQLIDASEETVRCDGSGRVIGEVPDAYRANYDAASFFVQADPLTSPLYLRPLNLASHPRRIFAMNDPAAQLITEWITRGAE